ncbi:MAG: hypothetical protein ACJ8BE_21885, partial [Microvirga sp.]
RLSACIDIAVDAAFSSEDDCLAKVFAGRTIVALASDTTKRQFAEHIRANASALPAMVVWDAVEGLFPTYVSVVPQ